LSSFTNFLPVRITETLKIPALCQPRGFAVRLPATGRRLGEGGGTQSVIRTTNGQFHTKGH